MNSRRGEARCGCARAAAGARRKDALLYRRGCSGSAPPPADPAPRRLPGEVPAEARCARPQGGAGHAASARRVTDAAFVLSLELSIYKRFVQSTQAALCFTHRALHVTRAHEKNTELSPTAPSRAPTTRTRRGQPHDPQYGFHAHASRHRISHAQAYLRWPGPSPRRRFPSSGLSRRTATPLQ